MALVQSLAGQGVAIFVKQKYKIHLYLLGDKTLIE